MKHSQVDGQVCLISGAGSGIGRATAIRFAEEGAMVAILDKDEHAAMETKEIVCAIGAKAAALKADVSNDNQVAEAIARAERELGPIDILFNNAGIACSGTVMETSDETLQRLFSINVQSIFVVSRHVLPAMIDRRRGSIINTGSVSGMVGVERMSAYCASKGAVIALTRAMAIDYAPYNIRINCVCPGLVATDLVRREFGEDIRDRVLQKYPLGRIANPQEVADLVLFLAGDKSGFITGAVMPIDGGMTAQ